MTFHKNINSLKMKTVGAVVFIHLLLLIAGVEPNPGPPDKQVLAFRYQYLLIEVGTELLRKLYDDKKSSYKDFNKDLTGLLASKRLTNDQKKLLHDKNPNTAKYDITLLTCLLRNTCGLKHPMDSVWVYSPANTDLTVEAEITRLRECRNDVVHKGTVYMSESDFNQKWPELCQILHRLNNNFCGVPNLSDLINDASSKRLDDELKTEHENTLKAWYDSDNLLLKRLDDLETGQSEVCDGQSQLKDGQSELKDGQSKIIGAVCDLNEQTNRRLDHVEQALDSNLASNSYTNDDIKECLRKSYEQHFRTVCVTPLYSEDDRLDMLTVYSRSKMKHVPYHRTRQNEGNYKISSYEQVFSTENSEFKNIFITGDTGMGKTSFCQFMSLLWSKAIAGNFVGDTETQEDARFMTKFDFVFYISLKETSRVDIVRMIVDKYFFTPSNDKYDETIKTIEQLLKTKNCLVILDGLDEWRPETENSGHRNLSLPIKITSDRCTYLTTCRPYRIETVRLSENDIDHQVQITGFDHEKYIREVISYINKSQNKNKDPGDFMKQIREREMVDQLDIPLITSQLIVVWFEYEISKMNRAMLYSSIVNMLFARAIKNEIKFPSTASSYVELPKSFSGFEYLLLYVYTLEKVCRLSFLLLFDPNNKTPSLVFTKSQLMSEPYSISSEEIDFLCQLGIISKNKVIASFGQEKHMLSFLHTSYLEFLAALFVSMFDKTDLFCESVKKICINNVSKYENFCILLSGISSDMTRDFFEIIYKKEEWDLFRRNCFFAFLLNCNFQSHYDMQNISLCCLKEICVSDNSQRFIKLEDFEFTGHCEHLQDLKALFVSNKDKHYVKSLDTACYLEEFNEVKCLQYLMIGMNFDVRFKDVMLQNKSTLHSLLLRYMTLSSEIPVKSLPCLTSIRFDDISIKHAIVHDLMSYISGNTLLENIFLFDVRCEEHEELLDCSACLSGVRCEEHGELLDCNACLSGVSCEEHEELTLNLSDHSKLLLVTLSSTNIRCSRISNSSLTSLYVQEGLVNYKYPKLTNVVKTIQNSKLEYLFLSENCIRHRKNINDVIIAISSLKNIKYIELYGFTIPDSVPLQIHPDIVCDKYIYIKLVDVRISDKCFQGFIHCVVEHKSVVRVCISDSKSSPQIFQLWKPRVQSLKAIPCVRILTDVYEDDNDDNEEVVDDDNDDDEEVVDDDDNDDNEEVVDDDNDDDEKVVDDDDNDDDEEVVDDDNDDDEEVVEDDNDDDEEVVDDDNDDGNDSVDEDDFFPREWFRENRFKWFEIEFETIK